MLQIDFSSGVLPRVVTIEMATWAHAMEGMELVAEFLIKLLKRSVR